MMQCWMSDAKYPVVTEINLDAVEQNGNQFPAGEVTEENGWVVSRVAVYQGVMRDEAGVGLHRNERNGSNHAGGCGRAAGQAAADGR